MLIKFFLAAVIFAFAVSFFRFRKVKAAQSNISKSPKAQAICNMIFKDGAHPSRIIITWNNEIFYGPQMNGEFLQVPPSMVPNMSEIERVGLGSFLEQKGYKPRLCNGKNNINGKPGVYTNVHGDTGNQYLDYQAHCFLMSSSATGGKW